MTIFNIYIFDREGQCLYYDEWFRTKHSGLPANQEHKLVFGMMISLKSFAKHLATSVDGSTANQAINFYKTSTYKMNFLESATGIKVLLNSDPNAVGMGDLLQRIYQAWVEAVNSPLTAFLQTQPDAGFLQARIREVVMKNPAYV